MSFASRQPKKIAPRGRVALDLTSADLVKVGSSGPGQPLPLIVEPAVRDVDLIGWAGHNHATIEGWLSRHGAVLFRGFPLPARASALEEFIRTLWGEALEYRERSAPRTVVDGRIYTSTDYPPDQTIYLHNEQSYNVVFPLRILFYCLTPSPSGGETPLADVRRVYDRIPADLRDRLAARRYQFVRNFGHGIGLDWPTTFRTEDPAMVESYCRQHDISFEWRDDGRLRTRQVRRFVAHHPRTGEASWFNHATFFHASTLPSTIRDELLTGLPEEDWPSNTYYGDGEPFEPDVLDRLRAAYDHETVRFRWEPRDLLLVDNLLVAHGRSPYAGPRQVVVGMAEPCHWEDV